MTNRVIFRTVIIRCFLLLFFSSVQLHLFSQEKTKINITGNVTDAVTGEPINQVLISISGTSASIATDENGKFEIPDVEQDALIIAQHPDFDIKEFYLHGRNSLNIKLVPGEYKSVDDLIVTPYGDKTAKKIALSFDHFSKSDLKKTSETSFERCIQGKTTGLKINTMSGMPGALSVLAIRGPSTIYGKNDPVVLIDGILHEIHYPIETGINGFVNNPLEIVDIDDIESITVLKDAQSYLGSLGSNGVIVINTEEKKETSAAIRIHMYQGYITPSKKMSLMDANQFNSYFNEQIISSELSQEEINTKFPWLSGNSDPLYSNNTDWQDKIFKSGLISKYHIFLKGGDNIGNLNMSTGYLKHTGIIENTSYSRFNLRVNSKINITNKFSFIPNVKLSTSDSYLMEQGASDITNPIIAANLKPPITRPYLVEGTTSEQYINDIDAFPVSNPVAIVSFLTAQNKNYQFMASGKAQYDFTKKISATTNFNLSYNSSRDNIFIPDKGLLEIDSARNSMRATVTEYRSIQNNFVIDYNTNLNKNTYLDLKLGNLMMKSSYEYDMGTDLNSATDDFRSLGSGSEDSYLRRTIGAYRTLNLLSIYTIADFSYMDKCLLNVSFSVDGNSTINKKHRYNMYYSVAGAWNFISGNSVFSSRFDELKLRASYGITGNIFNEIYDYSRLFYIGKRLTDIGVLVMESIPNEDMEVEKKTTINLGFDLSSAGQKFNTSIDVFYAKINNLIISQKISATYGYPNIYNNTGALATKGIEFTADYRFKTGKSLWIVGLTASSIMNEITKIDQNIAEGESNYILTPIDDTQNSEVYLITEIGEPVYSFFGYETDGIYTDENEANSITGPNNTPMHAGDVKFIDQDNNGIINEKDRKIIGNPDPLVYGAFFITYGIGRIKATANFSYSIGNKIYNYLAKRTGSMDNFYNQSESVTNRWRDGSSESDLPRAAYGDPSGNNYFSDRWIEDGSYLRLKNITVSYDFRTLDRFFKYLEVYLTGSNLLTYTKYSGYDPEFLYINNMKYTGIDYGKMPFGRSVIIGINLGL